MAATKSAVTIQSSTSNSAGGTTTASSVDLTTAYGMLIAARITNGGSAPTTPCRFVVEVSHNGTDWFTLAEYAAGTTASTAYDFAADMPQATRYARTRFTGNTGQAVTVEAYGHKLTGI